MNKKYFDSSAVYRKKFTAIDGGLIELKATYGDYVLTIEKDERIVFMKDVYSPYICENILYFMCNDDVKYYVYSKNKHCAIEIQVEG